MWETLPREVLVAVVSADADAVLLYAADEARRRRCGVHLMHVAPLVEGDGPAPERSVSEINDELHRIGTNVLRDAAAKLERELRDDDLTVSTELCRGAVVPSLIAESSHGCLLIIQRRGVGTDRDGSAVSATDAIAADARASVVAVPADWRPPPPLRTAVVTVGVQDAEGSAEVVRVALEHADRAAARLHLVHACIPQGARRGRLTVAAEARRVRSKLAASFAELLAAHPEVPVEITITQDEPADALLRLAVDSSLLVVGRRHSPLPTTSHLGPVARTVLHGSPVPVLVVDPASDDRRRADHAARAGATIP